MLRLFAVLLALMLSSFGVQAKKNPIVIQAPPPGPTVVMAVSANSSPGYVAPASIWVSVEAYDSTDEVTELSLYKNNVLVTTVYDWILETSIDNLSAGSYVIKVVATNSGGGSSSKSQTVTITAPANQAPVITLNAPSGGPFIAPATVVWTSSASDSDGSINRVEYYANGTHIGTATSSPYQLTPTNVSAGTYSVVAKAVDNTGAVTTSNAVSVTVDPTTVRGVIDDLSLVSNEYRLTGWACSSGRNQSIDVHMYLGGPAGSGVWGGSYTANVGSELAVANACQAGGINYRFIIPVTAQMRADHAGKKVYIHGISPEGQPNLLINGSGVFAVPALQPPTVSVSASSGPFFAPASVTLSATASDSDGYITKVEFYDNGTLLNTDTVSPYDYNWTNVGAGNYSITARAYDQGSNATTSAAITVTVQAPNNVAPSVSLAAPSLSPAIAPATIDLAATASDSDGSVSKVEFYNGSTLLGTDTTAPYSYSWPNVAAGTYSFTAKATDNSGAITPSAAQSATVSQTTVIGNVEEVRLVGAEYRIFGWTCSTGRNQSIDVHLYAGGGWPTGTYVGAYSASLASEATVAQSCQASGTAYRFQIPLTAAIREQHAGKKIYIHGISPENLGNPLIGNSGALSVPAPLALTRRYVYDSYQQLCKVIEPETGSTVMQYDGAGNVMWSASGLNLPDQNACNRDEAWASNRAVLRDYDARNRIKTLSFPDRNGDQDWQYYPDGLPKQVTTYNDAGNTQVINAYSYNKRRLLTGESLTQPNWYSWGVGYGYDANGNLATQFYPTGLSIDYTPNALGQPTRAGSYATGVQYFPNGGIKQFTYGNGVVHTMIQNARQLPQRSTDSGVFDFTFAYDTNGNTTNIDDVNQVPGQYSGSRDMQYDGLDRLKAAHLHWWQINNFTYDAIDNIRSKSHYNGSTTTNHSYWYDAANRLTNIQNTDTGASVTGLGYDVQGNLQNKNGQAYVFDYGNRLRAASGRESYRYDGYGRRVVAWRPAGVAGPTDTITVSQYSQAGQVTYQENSSKTLAIENVYLSGSLVASRERDWTTNITATKYQHTDALGSPVAVTNDAGQVVERTNYEPYGAAINKTVDGVGYTGHVMDAATGLTYMQQRYYDPGIGAFISVDPVAVRPTGDNFCRYCYARNNPYKFTDPDGREAGGGYATGQYTMQVSSYEGVGTVADFLPGIGDIKGFVEAFQNPTFANVAGAVVGVVPVVGDVGGKLIKNADNVVGAVKGAAGGERAGKPFTRAGKAEVKADNAAKNGGQTKCSNCGQATVPGQQSRAGVTPPKNETHVDHVVPQSKGGNGSPDNGQVLCRECNLQKGDR